MRKTPTVNKTNPGGLGLYAKNEAKDKPKPKKVKK